MPLDLEIIRASEFIRVGPQGRLDLSASRDILQQLAQACHKRGLDRALLDLRELRFGPTPVLSRNDLSVLVNAFLEAGFSKSHRLAILYATDPHRRARLFAFLTTLHGGQVKACTDFEDALYWLSERDEEATQNKPKGRKVPVQFGGHPQAHHQPRTTRTKRAA
jgi:hypothetical protein